MTGRLGTAIVLLLLASCRSEEDYKVANLEREVAEKQATQKRRTEPSLASRIDNPVATGRIKNAIDIDTDGCSTLEGYEEYIMSSGAVLAPGCINLDRGDKVIGPLEVRTVTTGQSDFRYARIEVPGKGEVWTFLSHLAK